MCKSEYYGGGSIEKISKNIVNVLLDSFSILTIETTADLFSNKIKSLLHLRFFFSSVLSLARQNLTIDQSNASQHGHNTGHGYLLRIPKHRTVSFEKSPHYNTIIFYNKLASAIKLIRSTNMFQYEVKSLLVDGCYFSYQEFLEGNKIQFVTNHRVRHKGRMILKNCKIGNFTQKQMY